MLDDAIREHLELKRRRGADPEEVAREQREALAPIPELAPPDATVAADDTSNLGTEEVSSTPLVDPSNVRANAAQAPPTDVSSPESISVEETAELDMSTVLGDEPAGDGGATRMDEPAAVDPGSLEWEIPAEEPDLGAEPEKPDEDVLEETPDFLRDTPEQERLWFEQRPPRDFDFDD